MVHCIYSGVTGNSFKIILNFFLIRLILSWLINSADSGEILQNHLGLQCLQTYPYGLMLANDKALRAQKQNKALDGIGYRMFLNKIYEQQKTNVD